MVHNADMGRGVIGVIDVTDLMVWMTSFLQNSVFVIFCYVYDGPVCVDFLNKRLHL